jgi:hypothetical protein
MKREIAPYWTNFYFIVCNNKIVDVFSSKNKATENCNQLAYHRNACENCKNALHDGFKIPSKIKFVEEFLVRSEKLLMLQKRVIKQEYGLI